MKSYRRRSPSFRKAQRSSYPRSSRRAQPKFSNVVPPGTVASRVSFLENHPPPDYALPRRSTPNRTRGQSRSSFGRRMTNRFEKSGSRNEHPYEEPHVEIKHSFLGLNNTSSKHLHEHGLTDGISDRRDTYGRANRIHGQMHPQWLTERGQYDAASPWPITPEKQNSTCWRRNEMDVLEEGDASGIQSHFPGRTYIFPTLASGIGHADMYSRGTKSRQGNTTKSDISVATTSTVRRQSVRDLFDHHGIERPHGLVSDEALPREETPQQVKSKIRCPNCAWSNSETSDWCIKCKKVLPAIRHMESQSLISPKGQPSRARNGIEEDPSSLDSSAKENQPTKQPRKQTASPGPGPRPLQNPKGFLYKFRKLSTPQTKFPSFNIAQSPPTSPPKSRTISRNGTLPAPPLLPRLLKGSRTTTIVKESPFLIADRLLSAKSSQYFPITPQGDMYCPAILSNGNQCQKGEAMLNDPDCESPGCQATHENHQPYRHSIACSRLKKRIPEETDNGYVADTSFAEDSGQPNSLLPYKPTPHVSKQHSNRSLKSRKQEVSLQSLGSKYVECRGYPRTGHARHGSATSGALGQCQHCIDDCQCSACQDTHHSVRCCLNENHQGMVHHHHHSSQAVSSTIYPLDCPTLSCHYVELSDHSPPASPARSIAVTPVLQHMKRPCSPSAISRMDVSIRPLSKQSTIEKPRRLPRSKQGASLRGVSKQPTPPPWVSDPTAKTPSWTQVSKLPVSGTTADTIFDMEGIPDPPPPFKERPTLPLPLPCDTLSSEQGGDSPVRTWVNILSDHEHKDNNPCCSILSCDKSGWDEKQAGSPSARSVMRASKTSTPDSKKLSRVFSELFRFGEENTVPLLNQKLLERQEELRKIEKQCDDTIEALTRDSESYSHSLQPPAVAREDKGKGIERETSYTSSRASGTTKKRRFLGFSLEDKKPMTPCHNDDPVQEHMLSEDATVDEKGILNVPGTLMDFETEIGEHECVWRTRFVASQNENRSQRGGDQECGDQALKGVTVVVHIEGKDDLVIEADLRKGSVVKAKANGRETRCCPEDIVAQGRA